ncbi:MAG: hypothetical protein QM796_11015 [Chthoniobacteraceae bacterium]
MLHYLVGSEPGFVRFLRLIIYLVMDRVLPKVEMMMVMNSTLMKLFTSAPWHVIFRNEHDQILVPVGVTTHKQFFERSPLVDFHDYRFFVVSVNEKFDFVRHKFKKWMLSGGLSFFLHAFKGAFA